MKRSLLLAVGLLLLTVLAVVLLLLYLQTAGGRDYLARVLSGALSNGDRRVRIVSIEGDVPRDMSAGLVTVSDAEGEWLSIRDLHVRMRAPLSRADGGPALICEARTHELVMGRETTPDRPVVDVSVTGVLRWASCRVTATAASPKTGRLRASADMPVRFRLRSPILRVQADRPLAATLDCDLDLELLNGLPLGAKQRFAGRLTADLRYERGAGGSRSSGTCEVTDLAYEHYLLGTAIADGHVILRGDSGRLVLEQAVATDGGKGSLSAVGNMDLSAAGLPFSFDIDLRRAVLMRTDLLTAVASGRVSACGSRGAIELQGDLTVNEADLYLDSLPSRPPPALEMLKTQPPTGDGKKDQARAAEPGRVPLKGHILVRIPGPLRVSSATVDTHWQGQLDVAFRNGRPIVTGQLKPQGGRLSFLGRDFSLNDGTVRFDGADPPMPLLDLTAVHERRDFKAMMDIRGRAPSPDIELRSDPPLPSDEILTRVLFGRGVTEITPLQALEVAAAASGIRSGRAGAGIFDRARSRLGVDRLAFQEGGDENESDTALVVGKHVSDRLYVELQGSLGAQGGGIRSEYELHPNWTVETDIGSSMRSTIGINWRKDY